MKQIKKISLVISLLTFFSFSTVFSLGLAIEHAFFYPAGRGWHILWNFFLLTIAFTIWGFVTKSRNKRLLERVENLLVIEQNKIDDLLLEMKKLNAEKEQLKAEKMHFIDVGGHEIRAAITPVLVAASQLSGGDIKKDFEKIKVFLPVFEKNLQRLVNLTNDLLDLARIDAGRKKLKFEFMDVVALEEMLLRISEEVFQPLKKRYQRPVEIKINISKSFGGFYTDFSGLELILANLVSNAAKYTLQGCVEINVSQRGIATLVEVKDTGIGISEDKKEKIFEPFERAHNTREINVESTGLGLAIARQMAETLGGTLSVESILGQGSRFILRFETKQGGGTDGKNLEKD